MAKKPKAGPALEILQAALLRKQKAQPSYSLRALARDLSVSPAFISKVMSGEKLPPKERLEKLCYVLELDLLEKEAVVKAVLLDNFGAKLVSGSAGASASAKPSRKTSEASNRTVLSSWMNLALLEGLSLRPPLNELPALQKRLGITERDLKATLKTLADAGLIEEAEGSWRKKDELLYIAGGRSRAEARAFHEMMMARAVATMKSQTSQSDYERRLINGFTLAVNPAHTEAVKAKILHFLDELSREAGAGPCTEVYQINLQFFPLTKALPEEP